MVTSTGSAVTLYCYWPSLYCFCYWLLRRSAVFTFSIMTYNLLIERAFGNMFLISYDEFYFWNQKLLPIGKWRLYEPTVDYLHSFITQSFNSPILHLPSFNFVNVNATLLLRSFHCCLFTVPSSRAVTNIWNVGQWVFRLELYLTSRFNSEEWRDKDNRVITQLRVTFGECTKLLYECMYAIYIAK